MLRRCVLCNYFKYDSMYSTRAALSSVHMSAPLLSGVPAERSVENVADLRDAIANTSVAVIILHGGVYSFDDAVSSSRGPTALLFRNRNVLLRAKDSERVVLDARASVTDVRRVITVEDSVVTIRGVEVTGGFSDLWGGGVRAHMPVPTPMRPKEPPFGRPFSLGECDGMYSVVFVMIRSRLAPVSTTRPTPPKRSMR